MKIPSEDFFDETLLIGDTYGADLGVGVGLGMVVQVLVGWVAVGLVGSSRRGAVSRAD